MDSSRNESNGIVEVSARPQGSEQKSTGATYKLKLPSLAGTSAGVLVTLYGVLFIFVVIMVELGELPLPGALGIYAGLVALQFFVSPFILDWWLRRLGSLEWVGLTQVPAQTQNLILNVCKRYRLPVPRIGIIDALAPQAFTYGNTPSNARLVFSRGMVELLNPDEFDAVIAHELGHIQHRDFIFMTIAQLVPIIFYSIYGLTSSEKGNKKSKDNGQLAMIGFIAYILYQISQYIVLFLSRTREYWADRFSMENIPNPNALGTALLKICTGYGAKQVDPVPEASAEATKQKRTTLTSGGRSNPILAFNIAGQGDSRGWAASISGSSGGSEPDSDRMKKLMRWDLWNPWATILELASTHPIMGKRLVAVGEYAEKSRMSSPFVFNLIKPRNLSLNLASDLLIYFLPHIIGAGLFIGRFTLGLSAASERNAHLPSPILLGSMGFALASLLKAWFTYPSGKGRILTINELLEKVDVSPVNPVVTEIRGKVIGRGNAGDKLGSDLYLQDENGIIFLALRSWIPFYDFIFGVSKAQRYIGKEVIIKGWYRRAPMPYVEVKEISSDTDRNAFRPDLWRLFFWGFNAVALYFISSLS